MTPYFLHPVLMALKRLSISVLFSLIFYSGQLRAQPVDSLLNALQIIPEDSVRVNTLIGIATAYLNADVSKVILYGNQAKALADKIGFRKGAAFALKSVGQGYALQANYAEAVVQFQKSLEIFASIDHKVGIANMLSNIGACYFNTGEDTQAIEFYLKSLRVSEEIYDTLRIATAMNNIGGVYNNKPATFEKALEYFKKSFALFEDIGYQDGIGTGSMNIGEIYLREGFYDSALVYFDKSLKVYEGTVDATFPLTYMGQIFADQGDFERALQYQQEALEIARGLDAKFEMTQTLIGLAETQKKRGRLRLAVNYYDQAQQLANEINARNELKIAFEGLAYCYAELGDYKKAYTYENLLNSIKSVLYSSDNDKKIQQLQFNFDLEKKQAHIDLLTKDNELRELAIQRQKTITYAAVITGVLLFLVALGAYHRYKFVRRTSKIIEAEKERSEELLLNILPSETAKELQQNGHATPRYYESVSVLFTDFKGFTTISGSLSPQELVAELNTYFIAFDDIIEKFNLEKIKTIGDAYMCAGGIPVANTTHPVNTVKAGLAMQAYIRNKNEERERKGLVPWELRVGIHTGPLVAGVVGRKKYAYDIWGSTVNIASRMESNGEPGKVNISSATYDLIKDMFECAYRGKISAKNLGEIDMYFVAAESEADSIPVSRPEKISLYS